MKPVHRSATDLIREMQGLPKDWGIEGYSAPKYGHLSRNPSYTV